MTSNIVALITTSSPKESRKISDGILKEKLAACVNRVPGVVSRYWWKGKIEEGREELLIVKTTRGKLAALTRRVKALHSYSIPEVIALPIFGGNPDYLRWLKESLR